jgi:cytochrome c oxidase subunit II
VNKGWSIFFGVVLLGTFLIWFIAPFFNWWLPENVSSYGGQVDYLFYVILGFTGFFFVLTEVVLVYAMYAFTHRPGEKAVYTHGNHTLELIWTIVPAGILLFIAFAQVTVWGSIKYQSRMPSPDLSIQILARQWEWRMRYPAGVTPGEGAEKGYHDPFFFDPNNQEQAAKQQLRARSWAEIPQSDDLHIPNEIHCWKDANVKCYLKTEDVLHSFTIPNLRLKQDALPGKTIPIWFKVTRSNTKFDPATGKCTEPADKRDAWEISCQELCGARHFAMRGRLYVHPSRVDYLAWLEATMKLQQNRGESTPMAVSRANVE